MSARSCALRVVFGDATPVELQFDGNRESDGSQAGEQCE